MKNCSAVDADTDLHCKITSDDLQPEMLAKTCNDFHLILVLFKHMCILKEASLCELVNATRNLLLTLKCINSILLAFFDYVIVWVFNNVIIMPTNFGFGHWYRTEVVEPAEPYRCFFFCIKSSSSAGVTQGTP